MLTLTGNRVTGGAEAPLPPLLMCCCTSAYAPQYVRMGHSAHFGACVQTVAPSSIIACTRTGWQSMLRCDLHLMHSSCLDYGRLCCLVARCSMHQHHLIEVAWPLRAENPCCLSCKSRHSCFAGRVVPAPCSWMCCLPMEAATPTRQSCRQCRSRLDSMADSCGG